MTPVISIVLPNRETENPYLTLKSLTDQIEGLEVIIVYDEGKGANWARNRGAELAKGEYLLFSDNDIQWQEEAIYSLYSALSEIEDDSVGYAYGWYEIDGSSRCQQHFNENLLRSTNYISTMSLMYRSIFPGFDESLQRLQDWDLWLTLLKDGITGTYCGQKIFTTTKREGITFGSGIGWHEARRIVMEKHDLR